MDKKLQQYAELVVKQGLNLEKGEHLYIGCPTHAADFCYCVSEEAYKMGAKKVTVFWDNQELAKLNLLHCDEETLGNVPEWVVSSRDYVLETKGVWLKILSENPEAYSEVNPDKIAIQNRAMGKALERFRESTSTNKTRWCIAAVPSKEWAKKMFPELSESDAIDKLWDYIHKTVRLDTDDAIKAWKEHQANLGRRSAFLNNAKIKSFHYKNSLGTDFTVGMRDTYCFSGAVEESYYGRQFTANIPTEEVFSSPDKMLADGILYSSMPLIHNGHIVDKFWFKFKDGMVVDFGAEKGYDIIKNILETDEGAKRLGEIALVGYNSPIQKLKTLFYCTLFDENASCHFALGRGFSACVKGGMEMTREQLNDCGLNYSIEHVDFMVGTPDLEITATTVDGKQLAIFKNGDWLF